MMKTSLFRYDLAAGSRASKCISSLAGKPMTSTTEIFCRRRDCRRISHREDRFGRLLRGGYALELWLCSG